MPRPHWRYFSKKSKPIYILVNKCLKVKSDNWAVSCLSINIREKNISDTFDATVDRWMKCYFFCELSYRNNEHFLNYLINNVVIKNDYEIKLFYVLKYMSASYNPHNKTIKIWKMRDTFNFKIRVKLFKSDDLWKNKCINYYYIILYYHFRIFHGI